MKFHRRVWLRAFFISLMFALVFPFGAGADQYPSRPIEVIVSWPPGGGADTVTRIVCKYAEKELGQNINVVNVTGGSGTLGYNKAATAEPDGYTLVNLQTELTSIEAQKIAPISRSKFTPIVLAATRTVPLVTRVDSEFSTFEELVEACRKAPGKINVAGSPKNTIFELAATLIMDELKIKFNYVPTGGSPKVVAAMAGNHVSTGFCWLSTVNDYLQKKEMKGLVVLSDKRLPDYPDIPTMKELGYDITYRGYYGIGAPAGLDPSVKDTLEKAFLAAVGNPECQEELKTKSKVEINVLNSKGFSEFLDNEYKTVSKVFKSKE